ncbi:MAG: M12 family metallo-peptidase, partial [Quisquiliibacterium sp.]
MSESTRNLLGTVLLAAALVLPATMSTDAGAAAGVARVSSVDDVPAGQLRDALLALTPSARARAIAILGERPVPLNDFPFMRADRTGGIFYVDPPPEATSDGTAPATAAVSLTREQVFKLHSKPGASRTLYIDFDGHNLINTAWNSYSGQTVLYMLPFDLDGDPSTFSQSELNRIAESWRRVSEDFAAFDVDVTTEEPPYTVGSGGRIEYGSTVGHNLITGQRDANGYYVYTQGGCGCGGVAYLNVFGNSYYQPGLSFNSGIGSNAMTISHETGHNLGLSHDGTSTAGYYSGHGSGETSWGPIMGAPFGKSIVTWNNGTYPDANNQQDDYAIIRRYLPSRTDDHSDASLASATPLTINNEIYVYSTTRVTDPGWDDLANKGVIEDRNDVDLFSVNAQPGFIDLTVDPAIRETFEGTQGADLDIQAQLLDSNGTVLQTSAPDATVGARIYYEVTVPGTYYLAVSGVGRAGSGSDYGYSDYGSVGQYYINGTVPPDVVITPPPTAPSDLLASLNGDNNISLTWTDPAAPPEANEAGYRIFRNKDGGGYTKIATLPQNSRAYADNNLANGQYRYFIEAFNSQGVADSAPTDPIKVDAPMVAVVSSEASLQGSVVSGSYVSTQVAAGSETISEASSGGRPSRRTSSLEHRWSVTGVSPAASVKLEVVASAPPNSEGDNFDFSYSLDGGASWTGLGTVVNGTGTATLTASLPPATWGTVLVRVRDTDQTVGAGATDLISVSLIRVTSEGAPSDQPPTVQIDNPANGTTVQSGNTLTLGGTATDYEDGNLSDSIAWSSSRDGSLGSGASASVSSLSIGTHIITASVTDSAGQTKTDSITVTVTDASAASSMHVAELVGQSEFAARGKWSAIVTTQVQD